MPGMLQAANAAGTDAVASHPCPTCQGARRAVDGHSSDESQAALAADEQLLQIIAAHAAGKQQAKQSKGRQRDGQ